MEGHDRRRARWAPAMLLSIGLLGLIGVRALPEETTTTTSAPETSAPDTAPPTSAATTTTSLPETSAPDTSAPETSVPETSVPETSVPPADSTTTTTSLPAPVDTIGSIGGEAGAGAAPAAEVQPADDATGAVATPDATDTGAEPGTIDVPVIPATPVGGWPLRIIRFPVAGPVSYGDDWGACRDNCSRHHIGNDLVGHRLQPLLAAVDGTITHFVENHPTAGWGLVITDAEGWEYRYYHVNNDTPGTDDGLDDGTWRFPPGITLGATVKAGQVVAFMGDSGNSEYSVPHVHFEIHRPDGSAVNPYFSLRSAELTDRCANAGDLYGNALFPQPARSSASVEVETITGNGSLLVGPDGAYVPSGDGTGVGDPSHAYDGFGCDQGGSIVGGAICSDEAAILATIRQMESGGDYQARAALATASGAYQYIDSTWNGYGGYASAWQAPPAVQDAKALSDVRALLATYGDVAKVPVAWYWPQALANPAQMDVVPKPEAGNRLTVRQYQQRWLAEYAAHQALGGTCR